MCLTCLKYYSDTKIPEAFVENFVCRAVLCMQHFYFTVTVLGVFIVQPHQYEPMCVCVCMWWDVNVTFQVLLSLTGKKHMFHRDLGFF